MIAELINTLTSMFHTTKKVDVMKKMELTATAINDEVIPTLNELIKGGEMSIIKDSVMLSNIATSAKLKSKNGRDTVVKLKALFDRINKSSKKLAKMVDTELSEVVTDKTATIKDAAILKHIEDMTAMTLFMQDICYVVLISGDASKSDLPKARVKGVLAGVPEFTRLLAYYNTGYTKILDDIEKLPTNTIGTDQKKSSLLETMVSKAGVKSSALPHGFKGSWIYNVKVYMMDREVAKYEALKEKKKLIELTLLDLKNQEDGESDPKLEQRIAYYEEKISAMEYEIKEFEEN